MTRPRKVSDEGIREIRRVAALRKRLAALPTDAQLAQMHGISRHTVRAIITGWLYKGVSSEESSKSV